MSDKKIMSAQFWGVLIGRHLLRSLSDTRADARVMLANRRRMEKMRPELCPEEGRARVVRILVQVED